MSPSNSNATASRKSSNPHRSASISDDRPGIIFKLFTGHTVGGGSTVASAFARRRSTTAFNLVCSQASQPKTITTRSRSNSVKNGGGYVSSSSFSQPTSIPTAMHQSRPRSNSLGRPGAGLGDEEESVVDVDISTSDDELDEDGIPLQSIGMGSRARKSSICHDAYPSPSKGPSSAFHTGSLSHLIPNRLLSTVSRRISVSQPHPQCTCASCASTITPYWRDGWSPEVMLCNACGLRYQKFGRRCPACVYIPRKEDSLATVCIRCSTPWIIG